MASNSKNSFDILDCLLPTGVVVPITCSPTITLSQLKNSLWLEARKYPSCEQLGAASQYVIVAVTNDLRQHTFWDESKRLADVPLYSPIIKLVLPVEPWEEGKLNAQIGAAIGHSLKELNECHDEEITNFRQNTLKVVCGAIACREQSGMEGIALYHHPPLLDTNPSLPPSLTRHLDQGYLHITIWMGDTKACSVRVFWNATPGGVMQAALDKLKLLREDLVEPKGNDKPKTTPFPNVFRHCKRIEKIFGAKQSNLNEIKSSKPVELNKHVVFSDAFPNNSCKEGTSVQLMASSLTEMDDPKYFVLKICGTSEYLLSEEPITQYKTIRQFVCRDRTPQLKMVTRGELYASLSPHNLVIPSSARKEACWSQRYDKLKEEQCRDRLLTLKDSIERDCEVKKNCIKDSRHIVHIPKNETAGKFVENKENKESLNNNLILNSLPPKCKRRVQCEENSLAPQAKKPRTGNTMQDSQVATQANCVYVPSRITDENNGTSSYYVRDAVGAGNRTSNRFNKHVDFSAMSTNEMSEAYLSSQNKSSSLVVNHLQESSCSNITSICKMLSQCCNFNGRHQCSSSSSSSGITTMSSLPSFTPSISDLLSKEFDVPYPVDDDITVQPKDSSVKCDGVLSKNRKQLYGKHNSGSIKNDKSTEKEIKPLAMGGKDESHWTKSSHLSNDGDVTTNNESHECIGSSSRSNKDPSAVKLSTACCTCCQASREEQVVNLWHPSLEGPLKMHVQAAIELPVKTGQKVYVRAGLYHGLDLLCPYTSTSTVATTCSSKSDTTNNTGSNSGNTKSNTISQMSNKSLNQNRTQAPSSRGIFSSFGVSASSNCSGDVGGSSSGWCNATSSVEKFTSQSANLVQLSDCIGKNTSTNNAVNNKSWTSLGAGDKSCSRHTSDEDGVVVMQDTASAQSDAVTDYFEGDVAGQCKNDAHGVSDVSKTDEVNVLGGVSSVRGNISSTRKLPPKPDNNGRVNSRNSKGSSGSSCAHWSEWLEFDLNLQDCPRATKLCFSVVSASGKEDEHSVIGCSTVNLFDWRGRLLQQSVTLPLSTPPAHLSRTPLTSAEASDSGVGGGASSNGGGASSIGGGASSIGGGASCGITTLLFPHLSPHRPGSPSTTRGLLQLALERRLQGRAVLFPSLDQVLSYARTLRRIDQTWKKQAGQATPSVGSETSSSSSSAYVSPSDEDLNFLCHVSEVDPFASLSPQSLARLWELRGHCHRVPTLLPRLLQAVNWADRDMVSQLYLLLEGWWSSCLPVSVCVEVLEVSCPDPVVRYTAVRSLCRSLTHHQLQQYLLQLCQCVLQEAYVSSPLLHLLLHRALTNSTFGHYFLHHMRCHPMCPRVLAVLEAYCRGTCPSLLQGLAAQVAMLNTLSDVAAALTRDGDGDIKLQDECKHLQEQLCLPSRLHRLQHLSSPLCPTQRLGAIKVSACSVLQSARKPLKVVWQNPDPMAHLYATSYSVIFKTGDDLRQDSLSLQVLGLMASIWAEEGLYLRITPYSCLAMQHNMGVIELVNNAKTVYSIQRRAKLGAIQVDSSQLYKWIKEHNRGPRLAQAIDTFTQSCAGYCVATFILGIGDRHPDNIMVNEEGQIFHIDFGHFLGNYKKKFGLHRERVPFVLTQDFLRVIAGGAENPKETPSFHKFQELCGLAYLALRRHSRLLLSLFALLLDTGLPELQSGADLAYLHRSLGVWCRSEEEALRFFQQQFLQASGGAWTTKLDWFFHSVKHR